MVFSSTIRRAVIGLGLGVFLAPAVFSQVAIIDANSRRSAPAVQGGSQTTSYPDPASGAVSYPADDGNFQYQSAPAGSSYGGAAATSSNPQVELLNRVIMLEDELMKLRGMLEEQQHQLEQLKQQRLEDYQSLDKRITESRTGGRLRVAGAGTEAGAIDASATPSAPGASGELRASAEGEQAYLDAYALINAKKYADARVAFQKFLNKYPNDAMVPNAMYWLGQLYLIESNDEAAKAQYTKLITLYPDNRKAPEAMYKLAQIHYEKGEKTKAKNMLNDLIKKYQGSGSPAIGLARDYLKQNF